MRNLYYNRVSAIPNRVSVKQLATTAVETALIRPILFERLFVSGPPAIEVSLYEGYLHVLDVTRIYQRLPIESETLALIVTQVAIIYEFIAS